MADFLFQAFVGKAWSWYAALPMHVQISWFALKNALYEEFGEGKVMKLMRLLCKEWWQVRDFGVCFEQIWKAYEQVSFFRRDFFQFFKSQVLEMHYQIRLEWAKAQSMQEVKDAGIQASLMAYLSTDEVVDIYLKEKRVSCVHVPKEDPLTRMEFSCDKVVSTKNKEWMSKFLDELQANRKTELLIEAAPAAKVELAVEKKGWNPLGLDLNADKRSKTRPNTNQLEKRRLQASSQVFGRFVTKSKMAKVEPMVEVQEVEEFVEPELLEVLDKKQIVDEDKVKTFVAIDVKAKEEVQEVVSMEIMTPTLDVECQESEVSEENFSVKLMP